ncbi:hypothetical protein [Emticicia sp. BO119]|uniref:hypothetical protein n=1 Tax=Emticicia sp. BO119 TaxID=2757768 RepID=UPI0015F08FB4|nr:hypothetical protein [Emticicia sp. BO119]MBA4849409.1 hypothetical protein [Emticicia sp. BO119]
MATLTDIFQMVKTDFSNLTDFRLRGSTIEIMTCVSTITNHYVSVFVSQQDNAYVVSDGGWLAKEYYENSVSYEDEMIVQKLELQYRKYFGVETTLHEGLVRYYYKTTGKIELVSALVYDVSNYIAAVVNSHSISYNEGREQSQRQRFNHDVNSFLWDKYSEHLTFNDSLTNCHPELNSIKFNAIIRHHTDTYLIMYVSGYSRQNFNKDASEAYTHFQMVEKYSQGAEFIKIAIINTNANGYVPVNANSYLKLLQDQTHNQLVEFYKDVNTLMQYVPLEVSEPIIDMEK